MRRAKTVKALFWELRAAGVEGSAKDVLRLAYFILRSHQGEVGASDDFGRVIDSRALPMLPVDVAMQSGGWRLVEYENSQCSHLESDATDQFWVTRKIERLVGKLWPL